MVLSVRRNMSINAFNCYPLIMFIRIKFVSLYMISNWFSQSVRTLTLAG